MTPSEYLDSIKARLFTDALVGSVQVRRERVTEADGHIRARLEFADDSWLEFSEYFRREGETDIEVVTYSYHWATAEGRLIQRWDNTPHFPELPGFPHHVHVGEPEGVESGSAVSIFSILDEIARKMEVALG